MTKVIATLLAFAIILLAVIAIGVWKKVDLSLGAADDLVDLGYSGVTHATTAVSASVDADGGDNRIMEENAARKCFRIENPPLSGDTLTFILDNATSGLTLWEGFILEAGEYYDSCEAGVEWFGEVLGIASSSTTTISYVEK